MVRDDPHHICPQRTHVKTTTPLHAIWHLSPTSPTKRLKSIRRPTQTRSIYVPSPSRALDLPIISTHSTIRQPPYRINPYRPPKPRSLKPARLDEHDRSRTYSVLTRLPAPSRADASTAVKALGERLPSRYVTLDATSYAKALARLAQAGIDSGATYDGLIALTALEHDLELVSRDRRAARSYRALGVQFTLLE